MTTVFPIPLPTPQLLPFEVDLDAFFLDVLSRVRSQRARRQQPPLVPDNQFLIGQESLSNYVSAPAIAIVPRGARFNEARYSIDQDEPRLLLSQWIRLECHCWGHDDPAGLSQAYSFSTSLELFRQLYVALQAVQYGPAHVLVSSSEFVQKTDVNRQGRMFVANVDIETFLVVDPPLFVPVATSTTPGIQSLVTMDLTTSDGSSTVTEAQFVVPP